MQNKETSTIKRGDIYYFDFGEREQSIQSGRRPVMVLQADEFNRNAPTIIVASITTVAKKRYLPSHIFLGEDFGLSKPSMLLLEQIQTVNKSSLTEYMGHMNDEKIWKSINIAIKKTFGLWFYNNDKSGDVRCLCQRCLNDYMYNPNIRFRRLDPFALEKEKCDKCNGMGYEYVIYDRSKQV